MDLASHLPHASAGDGPISCKRCARRAADREFRVGHDRNDSRKGIVRAHLSRRREGRPRSAELTQIGQALAEVQSVPRAASISGFDDDRPRRGEGRRQPALEVDGQSQPLLPETETNREQEASNVQLHRVIVAG